MPNHTESHAWMPVRPVTTGNFVMLSQRDYETLMDTMNRYRAALVEIRDEIGHEESEAAMFNIARRALEGDGDDS